MPAIDVLGNPGIAATRERLRAAGRGAVVYDAGSGGSVAVIAAAADLAVRAGSDLVVVDAAHMRLLHQQLVVELHPRLRLVTPERLARDIGAVQLTGDEFFPVIAAITDRISVSDRYGRSGRHLLAALSGAAHPLGGVHPWKVLGHAPLIDVAAGEPPVRVTLRIREMLASTEATG